MNGPEHYRVAEELLDCAADLKDLLIADAGKSSQQAETIAFLTGYYTGAQAHATLALVAAVANIEIPSANILNRLADAPSAWANGRGDSPTWRGVLQ